ncbi:MAG: cysteine hydrolase family protein [Chloroflexota bacterium]
MSNKSAFLVIDAQVNMFDEAMPVHDASTVLAKLDSLCQQARQANVPIIFVRHDGGVGEVDEYGTEGWQVHPQLAPQDTDIFVDKRKPDAFEATQLQNVLQMNGIEHLVIAGMQTDYCVNATTNQAILLGYAVTLVADAHSTFDSEMKLASEIIAEFNENMANLLMLRTAANIMLL